MNTQLEYGPAARSPARCHGWDDEVGVTTAEWIGLSAAVILLLVMLYLTVGTHGTATAQTVIHGFGQRLQMAWHGERDGGASQAGTSAANSQTYVSAAPPSVPAQPSAGTSARQTDQRSAGEQVAGFFKGFGRAAWGMVEGFGTLASDAVQLMNPATSQAVLEKYTRLGQAIWADPKGAAYALVEPTVSAWRDGRYGEAIGAGAFEIASLVVAPAKLGKVGKTAAALDKMTPDEVLRFAARLDKMSVREAAALLQRIDRLTPDEIAAVRRRLAAAGPDELAAHGIRADDLRRLIPCSFSGDTPVMTRVGLKAIRSLLVGELVLAYHEATGEIGYYPILARIAHHDPIILTLTLDGEQIETTPEHPFATVEPGWMPAGALQVGDQVRRATGGAGIVQTIAYSDQPQLMYNLTVAEAHTFFVGEGGWLVHNADCIRAFATRPFANNAELNTNVIEQMYRGEWVDGRWISADSTAGGLAGAIRRQLATGELVGGVDHLPKGEQRLTNLKRILRTGEINGHQLDQHDLEIVRGLHDDLLNALQGK